MGTAQTGESRWDGLREQQRSAVVDAIIALVSEGATAVTIVEVADRAGMSRPTFYKYFPTFGAAMLFTHRAMLDRVADYVDAHLGVPVNAREHLLAVAQLRFDFLCEHPDLLRFFSYFDFTFRRFGLTDQDRAVWAAGITQTDTSRDLFVAGQADGSVDAGLPVEATLMALSGSLVGLSQRLLIQDEYSSGLDQRARVAHAVLIETWRSALTP